jgi:Flp pilus assembly pilin Flp
VVKVLKRVIRAVLLPRSGQTLVEYGMVLILVSVAAVTVLLSIGQLVIPMLNSPLGGF